MDVAQTKLSVLLCSLFLLSGRAVRAQSAQDSRTSPADEEVFAMLKEFYTGYILGFTDISPEGRKREDSILRKYCEPALLRKIDKKTRSGELDWDPFLDAQDMDTTCIKTLKFAKDAAKPDVYVVSYVYPGEKKTSMIHLNVARPATGYKIRDVW